MASISKRESGAWQNTSYGIRATTTDTITTLPTTIYGDGTNAAVSIKGNTVQSGTPTSDNPIIPQGCGELEAGQYKIPISSANTTTPIFLGEVPTTRLIKKLVLTGEESGWTKNDSLANSNAFYHTISGYYRYSGFCTHYATVDSAQAAEGAFFGSNINFLTALSDNIDTIDKWKNYLRQQYAAGTPVTIWYVLANEETAVVNEPLMRIGDYADEVLGVSIPTTDGANTLSVDTTVQPSEVSVNYHGWHMGTVHERNSDQWD